VRRSFRGAARPVYRRADKLVLAVQGQSSISSSGDVNKVPKLVRELGGAGGDRNDGLDRREKRNGWRGQEIGSGNGPGRGRNNEAKAEARCSTEILPS